MGNLDNLAKIRGFAMVAAAASGFLLCLAGRSARALDLGALATSAEAYLARQMNVFYSAGPRIPQSYSGLPELAYDTFTYDIGAAVVFAAKRGRLDLAQPMADACIVLQEYDPAFPLGPWHDAYWPNNLLDPSGHFSSVKGPNVSPGPNSWVDNGLIECAKATRAQRYVDSAARSADFIRSHFQREDGPGGFTLGLKEWTYDSAVERGTENNIVTYVAGLKLYGATGEQRWLGMASHAESFVRAMWDETKGYYLTGTKGADGTELNPSPVPADVQLLAVLSGIDTPTRTNRALDWVMNNLLVHDVVGGHDYRGIKFSDLGDHINTEATIQAAMALMWAGRREEGLWLLGEVDKIRLTAPNHDPAGIGIVATPWPDGARTGYGVTYPNALHVAPTVWSGLAAQLAQGDLTANPLLVPEPSASGLVFVGLLCGIAAVLARRHTLRRLRPRSVCGSPDITETN